MNLTTRIGLAASAAALVLCLAGAADGGALHRLWQIGREDDDSAEFALGPGGYERFDRDGLFIVGQSDPKRDWPYVHPGPADAWAGAGPHTFRILFALKARPSSGCRLVVDLVDTHGQRPPTLTVSVGGQTHTHRCPPGGGDASITGRPTAGKEHRFAVEVPASALRAGVNEVRITNASLSWVVYDAVAFDAPADAELAPAGGALIESVDLDPWLSRAGGRLSQVVRVTVLALGGREALTLRAQGAEAVTVTPAAVLQEVTLRLPPAEAARDVTVELVRGSKVLDARRLAQAPAHEREIVDYVDCLIGTSTSRWMLYPGPSMPFGMVKLSPDNQGHDPAPHLWKAGYEYAIGNVMGFSHVHAWTMGGLLTMPTTGPLVTDPGHERDPDAGYRSRIRHATETAVPGYYAVTLDDYGIRAELTCTTRAGFQRYTFPKSRQARILVDLLTPTEYGKQVLDAKIRRVSDREIEGHAKMKSGRHSGYQEYVLHFVARTNKPLASMDGWVGEVVKTNVKEVAGQGDVGAALNFTTADGEAVLLQTGISLVSTEQARLNLETEMKPFGWDFQACRAAARKVWQDLLSRIEVEGGSETDKVKFYTNLYRSYCARTIWSDVNGKYVDMYEKVQQLPDPDSPVLGCDAFWNTFWNLNQLWVLVHPEWANAWVRSLLEIYDKGGWLAKGPTGIEYSSIMVASHEIPLMVAAYQAGIRNYDVAKAYQAMVHCQTTPGRPHPGGGHVGNSQLKPYLEHGYIPLGKGYASNTLEYAYDDWCVAQMAKALGHRDAQAAFIKRAESWRNLFDAETGFMRPRYPDGRWLENFDPYSGKGGWVEGNPWQYTWFVPQNVRGLVQAMGRERFVDRLNEGLAKSAKRNFSGGGLPINHGNQPSMQVAYLFNYAGAPWLTQKWARAIMNQYYGDDPIDGWPGDEDQGQGGAWFVMSAIGLFQTDGGCRVRPIYEIGSPLFDRVTIHLDPRYYPGKTFTIEAHNNGPKNVYVQSATLDGKPLARPWFYQSDLVDGGTLVLEMGPEPNKAWGAGPDAAPPPTVPAGGKE